MPVPAPSPLYSSLPVLPTTGHPSAVGPVHSSSIPRHTKPANPPNPFSLISKGLQATWTPTNLYLPCYQPTHLKQTQLLPTEDTWQFFDLRELHIGRRYQRYRVLTDFYQSQLYNNSSRQRIKPAASKPIPPLFWGSIARENSEKRFTQKLLHRSCCTTPLVLSPFDLYTSPSNLGWTTWA